MELDFISRRVSFLLALPIAGADAATQRRRMAGSSGGIEQRGMGRCGGGISFFEALALHSLCAHGLAAGYWVASEAYGLALVSEPAATLRTLLLFEAPVVIGLYSLLRRDPQICPYWKASLRGILAIPIGAFINAFGAIVLGAPVSLKYWAGTIY